MKLGKTMPGEICCEGLMIKDRLTPDEDFPVVYSSLLNEIAFNLLEKIPSEICDAHVLQLERTLNTLYSRSYQEDWHSDLQNAILDALCLASELSDDIKCAKNRSSARARKKDFFKAIKRLVRLIHMIAIFVDEAPTDRTLDLLSEFD